MEAFQAELEALRQQQRDLEAEMAAATATHNSRVELMARTFDAAQPRPADAPAAGSIAPVTAAATEHAKKVGDSDDGGVAAAAAAGGGEGAKSRRAEVLQRYFDAMSSFPNYHERRAQRLSDVQPFSFELREARRAKSTKARRVEALREEEERKLQELRHHHFHANPVPPTTYLRKYELMVQEWCARKEAIRDLAERRAQLIKAAEAPGRAAAEALQMQKAAERSGARSAARAHSAHEPRRFPPFVAKEVPLECKVSRWDELRLAEEERRQRIRFRAEQVLQFARRPPRMEAETREHEQRRRAREAAAKDRKTAVQELRESNPNFTFRPRVEPTLPDYEYAWAKTRVELAQRKQSRPPTVPVEFKLHPTRCTTARIQTEVKRAASEGVEQRWPFKSSRAKVRPTPPPPAVPEAAVVRPAATRAHAVRCESVYRTIESRAEAEARRAREDRERRERAAEVRTRVGPLVGRSGTAAARAAIAQKVAEKKAAQRASSKEARERLDEIMRRVREKPPLFMEPTYLDQVARARAAAEEQVMLMLREHGLAENTLSAVMGNAAGGAGSTAAGAEHVTASDLEPSSVSAARVDDRSLVAPEAAVMHHVGTVGAAQPPPSSTIPTATGAAAATAAGTKRKKKKARRGGNSSSSSSSSSSSFESDSSLSSA